MQSVYYNFTNSQNGSLATGCVTLTGCTTTWPIASESDLAIWRLMAIVLGIMLLGFIFATLGGKFQNEDSEQPKK